MSPNTTKIDNIEYTKKDIIKGSLREIADIDGLVGRAFFFRTVTYHLTGRVVKVIAGHFLLLEDAAWVADSGRFTQAIRDGAGALDEVEPVGEAVINLDTVTDMFPWIHPLPTVQK